MNNLIKKIVVCGLIGLIVSPVMAADVSDRADCDKIQSRISELAAIESPTEAQSAELTQLQAQYRSNCSKSATGRRTSASRVSTATAITTNQIAATEPVIITAKIVLDDYLAERESLCNSLSADINTLKTAGVSDDEIKPVQAQYDADCNDIDKSTIVEIDTETAAANVAAGLCTDGSKPNKFGCCEGETYKDMGNLVFACCPDDGGECYPPINSGNAIW